jgi:hypothetical protein
MHGVASKGHGMAAPNAATVRRQRGTGHRERNEVGRRSQRERQLMRDHLAGKAAEAVHCVGVEASSAVSSFTLGSGD